MESSVTQGKKGKLLYMQATGVLPHPLTNDYMFKALLQKNKNVLKHLICSMLHLRLEEVESVEVKNPIVLGEAVTEDFDSKIFVLDINVLLNNKTLINLEMQVLNHENWAERSLSYLCRNFDQLSRGEDYTQVRPVIHIGFLDFTLFPNHVEFYATYKMINEKNHNILTDKFILSVVDLKQIDLATQEDRQWQIDYWASLFKATTWEEMKMLAKQSEILEDAVETIYELTADEAIREQCKAREKHVREIMTVLRERDRAVQSRDRAIQSRDRAVQERDRAVQSKDRAVQERDRAVQSKDRAVQERDRAVQLKDEAVRELEEEKQRGIYLAQENTHLLKEMDQMDQEKKQLTRQLEQLMQEYERLKGQQALNTN